MKEMYLTIIGGVGEGKSSLAKAIGTLLNANGVKWSLDDHNQGCFVPGEEMDCNGNSSLQSLSQSNIRVLIMVKSVYPPKRRGEQAPPPPAS